METSASRLVFQSTTELAAAVRERRVTAVEVLEAHLAQAAAHNPALNAVVTRDESAARQRAVEADAALARGESWGPLHGVPITVKDAFSTAGLRTTASFPPLSGYVPTEDATAVARLKRAGAIIWGKTNLPLLAGDYQTQSPLFGRTQNPHDLERTPGGSSGGAAAAVASGFTPFELGSDLGGSIRIPAHFCGLFGLKPTEHRVSNAGHIPDLPGGPRTVRHMACSGPLARTVADLRLVLSVIEGPDARNLEVPPLTPLAPPRSRAVSSLRIAWMDDFGGVVPCRESRAALARLVAELSAQGATVERVTPPAFDFHEAWSTWGELEGAEVGAPLPLWHRLRFQLQFLAMAGKDPLARAIARGARSDVGHYMAILERREALVASLERFLSGWDAWLVPVTTGPAIPHTRPGEWVRVDGEPRAYLSSLGAYTSVFNLTGNPVVVLPVGRTQAGLPLGAQLVGRRWDDAALLDVAEAVAPWGGGFVRPARCA
ncbi:amidase [Corallococcus sp. H22C18031201]|nr:amidase [Corallococcus sp. H22C18031201]